MTSIYYSPLYTGAIHPDARFPRLRYKMVYEELQRRGVRSTFSEPAPIEKHHLLRTHCQDYVERFLGGSLSERERRAIGLRPWTDAMIPRTLLLMGGSLSATRDVLGGAPCGANLAGGTHHAFRDKGAGYCVFNDLAVCSHYALNEGVERILIIDLDVHQGDGTASIFEDEDRVFTFSMHCQKNFPFRKQSSDLDIGIDEGMEDDGYLQILEKTLPTLLNSVDPELIFFQAGVDALTTDKLGRLNLSRAGLHKRNTFIFDAIRSRDLPLVAMMGGGYSEPIEASVQAHADVFESLSLLT